MFEESLFDRCLFTFRDDKIFPRGINYAKLQKASKVNFILIFLNITVNKLSTNNSVKLN